MDGSTPSETHGTVYYSPVNISATATLQAIAYETGYADSPVASGFYDITQCATPVFNPAAGIYQLDVRHHLHQHQWRDYPLYHQRHHAEYDRRYGYSSPLSITASSTLQAIAYKTGYIQQCRGLRRLHHPVRHSDVQPGGGYFYQVDCRHHLHQHQWRDNPLHHQWHRTERDRGHGIQRPGEHHRNQHAASHRVFERHG